MFLAWWVSARQNVSKSPSGCYINYFIVSIHEHAGRSSHYRTDKDKILIWNALSSFGAAFLCIKTLRPILLCLWIFLLRWRCFQSTIAIPVTESSFINEQILAWLAVAGEKDMSKCKREAYKNKIFHDYKLEIQTQTYRHLCCIHCSMCNINWYSSFKDTAFTGTVRSDLIDCWDCKSFPNFSCSLEVLMCTRRFNLVRFNDEC